MFVSHGLSDVLLVVCIGVIMLPSARVGLEGTAVGPQSDSVNFKIVGGNNQEIGRAHV